MLSTIHEVNRESKGTGLNKEGSENSAQVRKKYKKMKLKQDTSACIITEKQENKWSSFLSMVGGSFAYPDFSYLAIRC